MPQPGGRRATAAGLALAAALVGGCGISEAMRADAIATNMAGGPTADGFAWSISPWPLDETLGYLCVEQPAGFAIDSPEVDPASCAPLDVEVTDGVLVLTFDPARGGDAVDRLAVTDPPWTLAVAGRRGLFSYGVIRAVVDSPFASDPGSS